MKIVDANLLLYASDEQSHGAELHACDSDFSRFSRLRWIDPLD